MKKTLFLAILAVFNLLFYYSMRSFWSGIEGMFGIWWLAYLFMAILSVLAVLTVVMRIVRYRKPVMFWIVFGLSAALTVALGYMFYLGIGSLPYVLSTFTDAPCSWQSFILSGFSFSPIRRRSFRVGRRPKSHYLF